MRKATKFFAELERTGAELEKIGAELEKIGAELEVHARVYRGCKQVYKVTAAHGKSQVDYFPFFYSSSRG